MWEWAMTYPFAMMVVLLAVTYGITKIGVAFFETITALFDMIAAKIDSDEEK